MHSVIDLPPRFALAIVKSPDLWVEIENCAYVSGLALINGLDSSRLWALWNLASLVVIDAEGSHHLAEFTFPARSDLYALVTDFDQTGGGEPESVCVRGWNRHQQPGSPEQPDTYDEAEYRVDSGTKTFDWGEDITRAFSVPDDLGDLADIMGQIAREENHAIPRAIGMASAVSGAGSTSMAMHCARAIAQHRGVRGVIVVDPGGGSRLDVSCGVEDFPGARWDDVLSSIDDCPDDSHGIVSTGFSGASSLSAALEQHLPHFPEVDPGVRILSWGNDAQWLNPHTRALLAHHQSTPGLVLHAVIAHYLRRGWWVIVDMGSTWRHSLTAGWTALTSMYSPSPPNEHISAKKSNNSDTSHQDGDTSFTHINEDSSHPFTQITDRSRAKPNPSRPPLSSGWEWTEHLSACILTFPATLRGIYGAHTALEVFPLCMRRRIPTIALTHTTEHALDALQIESVLGIAVAGEIPHNQRHARASDIHGVLAVNAREWNQAGIRVASWAMQPRFSPVTSPTPATSAPPASSPAHSTIHIEGERSIPPRSRRRR